MPEASQGRTFVGELTEPVRRELFAAGHRRPYVRGATLFREGVPARQAFVVLSGRVKVFTTTADGRERIVAMTGAGELLGELAVVDGEPHGATAEAVEPVEALVIARTNFDQLLETVPGFAAALLRATVRRLRESTDKRVEHGTRDLRSRVARRLIELVEPGRPPVVRITQEQLAGWAGASRQAVVVALADLRSRGLVATERGSIQLLDVDSLRILAD